MHQLKKSLSEVLRLTELKEDIELKCKQLSKQRDELEEDKLDLLAELSHIKTRLSEREESARLHETSSDLSKQLKLQQKLDDTLDELYKLESEKEKYRIRFEAASAEQNALIEKVNSVPPETTFIREFRGTRKSFRFLSFLSVCHLLISKNFFFLNL